MRRRHKEFGKRDKRCTENVDTEDKICSRDKSVGNKKYNIHIIVSFLQSL